VLTQNSEIDNYRQRFTDDIELDAAAEYDGAFPPSQERPCRQQRHYESAELYAACRRAAAAADEKVCRMATANNAAPIIWMAVGVKCWSTVVIYIFSV